MTSVLSLMPDLLNTLAFAKYCGNVSGDSQHLKKKCNLMILEKKGICPYGWNQLNDIDI